MKLWHHLIGLFVLAHLAFVSTAPFPQLPFGLQQKSRALASDYIVLAGTRQSWRMFSGPPTRSDRLEIAMSDEDGEWTPLFRERSQEFTWKSDRLNHYRWREKVKQFNKGKKRTAFKLFRSDIANEVFDEFGEAQSVRFRVTRGRAPKPKPGTRRWTNFKTIVDDYIIKREER